MHVVSPAEQSEAAGNGSGVVTTVNTERLFVKDIENKNKRRI